jgi:hypothetical protein
MKYIYITFLTLLISGCSATPKVGDMSGATYRVSTLGNSSEALKTIAHTPITGVRDLTLDEFNDIKSDVVSFNMVAKAGQDKGLDSSSYALASTAVGSSLGLSLDYAAGLAILGKLAADDRAYNYVFSNDFHSEATVYSKLNSEEFLTYVTKSIPESMSKFENKMNSLYGIDLVKKPIYVSKKAGDENNKSNKDFYEYVGIAFTSKEKTGRRILTQYRMGVYCEPDGKDVSVCKVNASVKIGSKRNTAVSLLVKEFVERLPDGSVLYMPPRKDLYQLPMVYTTNGEPMLLVEAKQ